MSEPVEGVAGEDIKAGEKILLCADGYWRRKVTTGPARAEVAKPTPKRSRKSISLRRRR